MIQQLPKFIFCSIFVLIGIVISAIGIDRCIKAQDTLEWEKIEAELLSINLSEKEKWVSDDDGNSSLVTDRKVKSSYNYIYKEEEYFGKKITIGINYDKRKVYEKLKDALTISVYVNPQSPSESVIINKIDRSDVHIILIGFIWAGVVLAAMVGEFQLSSKIYYLILLVGMVVLYLCHFEFEWGKLYLHEFIEVTY